MTPVEGSIEAEAAGGSTSTPLVIGLINNMPKAARFQTERQFASLLATAAGAVGKSASLFVLDRLLSDSDETLRLLDDARPDGLIVTGTEPQSEAMEDEPVWPALARLVDWAGERTTSTVWSCLAAHAAVFRLDQIRRRRLPEKLSGVFTCQKVADHALMAGVPSRWKVPHSRYNGLDDAALSYSGYEVLSHSPDVGADAFVKQSGTSLFVLLQGHPEYGADSLLSEYRRDVRRFMEGHRDRYPEMPKGYFDTDSARALARLQAEECRQRKVDLLTQFDAAVGVAPVHSWHEPAVQLFAGWLSYLACTRPIGRTAW